MSKKPNRELFLSTNPDYTLTGVEALAQSIQNLFLIEQGTYPNNPDIGIGIENEQFESLDQHYLDDLKNKVELQIDTYIETDYNIEIDIEAVNVSDTDARLVLVISLFIAPNGSSNYKQVDLLFMKNALGNLISKVMI